MARRLYYGSAAISKREMSLSRMTPVTEPPWRWRNRGSAFHADAR